MADSAFGPRKSFCLAAQSVRGGEGAWPGLGQLCPHSPGSAEPSVSPQSCASSEDDSLSFRSRAASCATDSTSEDALSIRSEMIQRKGTRLGCTMGLPGLCQGGWGAWQGAGLCPRASTGIWGPLGEMRAALAESERWGWTDRHCLLPAQTVQLVPVPVPEPGLSQSSGNCWVYWGHWGHPGQGPPHTCWTLSHLLQVPPSDHTTPFPNPQRGLARRGRRGGRQCWASPSTSIRSWVSFGGAREDF